MGIRIMAKFFIGLAALGASALPMTGAVDVTRTGTIMKAQDEGTDLRRQVSRCDGRPCMVISATALP